MKQTIVEAKKPTTDRVLSFCLIGAMCINVVAAVVSADAGEYHVALLQSIVAIFSFCCLLQQDTIFIYKGMIEKWGITVELEQKRNKGSTEKERKR